MLHATTAARALTAAGLTLALTLAACSQEDAPTADGTPAQATTAQLPAGVMLEQAPANAMPVAQVKASAAEGDAVTVVGRIGGRRQPMTQGRAAFIIMDNNVPSCADNPDDNCPTPWDYCCETPDTIAANSASIQIVDDQGNPIAIDLAAAGFSPLDEVVVVGTVAERPSDAVLIIKATNIYKRAG